ncbi:hypothetical protein FLACHUCJ7_00004 [Flavobacterium chungangense]|uniref:Uncharacterized protein n=2 Tax=Flavobacterium TaxID=237 RepID=A0A6V6YLT3_9FLAO|nr:hypothetical protein FLAT13_00002 [Flavobacterium salmonis]CAD0000385.1 hypothetical protein FLACHUCJ7_00004 [Flavobacterium chungangense]
MLSVAVIVAVPAAFSAIEAVPLRVTVGTPLLSVMVPVPLAVELVVFPLVTVAAIVKVSLGSLIASTVVGTFTVIFVLPAGIVTVVLTVV